MPRKGKPWIREKFSAIPTNIGRSIPLGDELSLDPQDWKAFRRLAHEALDEALEFVEKVRERPVWQPVPPQVRAELAEPLPMAETPLETVYHQFRNTILPYATGNVHPRFFGWVHGGGQPGNIVAEMMAAAMNCNCGGRDHGAIYVEREVLGWCKQIFGFPAEASGLLVSGTSMANLIALGVARNATGALRANGLVQHPERLVAYTSAEAHESLLKGVQILGIGSNHLRKVPVNQDFTMDIHALRRAIADDRAAGLRPFCVMASAGTVNTGAIDDLQQLAGICAAENIWFHVDGAFGALCMLSDKLRPRLKGIEQADSLAFDFHKWAHVQYDAACVLVRRADLHRAAYSMRPPYLQHLSRGLGAGEDWPCEYGIELSRGFRALKVWFAFKEHGVRKLGRLIEQNCEQARYLEQRVAREPELELLSPASLNIVCFRVRAGHLDEKSVDRLNEEIVADVQESGVAAPSTSRVRGRLAIRVNITNHRTRLRDLDVLVDAVLQAARHRTPAKAFKTQSLPGA
jgi:aromatic-L-amino-acid/L-tryptophan decarboxylase